MIMRVLSLATILVLTACTQGSSGNQGDLRSQMGGFEHLPGYFDLYWDETTGRLIIEIEQFDEPFLYISSMARGVGSNDIGLDRGQLGGEKVVRFQRSGPKVLLIEDNLGYRALSDNVDEQNAVAESFASSVLWGFESLGEMDGAQYIDATEFLLRDAHRVSARLARMEEGDFKPDASRSAIYMPMTKAFPDNSEIEAIVTYIGQASGPYLPTVVPDSETFSVHLHHSFIRLPDENYEPLPFEPRAGGIPLGGAGFLDYASPVGDSLSVAYGQRFRLEKKDPAADVSEAVEPIVYYVDRGAPEPIRSALIEGASWWNQAFEAAGYRDAFRVELLPEDADPMDVRYNIIQWVHRSTRGWSYGGGIVDPRTGEIMKGKVTLGSLRVRQDYLIAEGLLAPYGNEEKPDVPMEMAIARIRQLSAHEVGHTIGFQHNMAASTQGRTSVMDYPHPLIQFDADGNINLDEAYAVGIGEWDKRTVKYAYQDFPDDVDPQAGRNQIMADTIESGLRFVSDPDSRPVGAAHPLGNLWDNGADAIEELNNLLRVRAYAMGRFSEQNIRPGRPMATLEEVLVPIYLIHRFQLNAVGKLIGGEDFYYTMRGDGQPNSTPVSADRQREAIAALLSSITPSALRIPDNVLRLLPPRPPGNPKSRETFPSSTGKIFEPIGAAQSAAALTLQVLLEPTRAARLVASNARQTTMPGFGELADDLLRATWYGSQPAGIEGELQRTTNNLVLERLMALALNNDADAQVRAIAMDTVNDLDEWLTPRATSANDSRWRAHYGFARFRIAQMRSDPASIEQSETITIPPGEPIGTTLDWY
ncbi:MAG: zinc-dependent metalloprotease [Woeseiaceae bacterium]